MAFAGQSSVTVSQRYVHPTRAGTERTMERFKAMNTAELERLKKRPKGARSYRFHYT